MDKWKDSELEKMRVGGNSRCADFFSAQSDIYEGMSLQEKYNTRGAALYRDKIATEAEGKTWSEQTSSARNWKPPSSRSSSSRNSQSSFGGGSGSGGDEARYGNGMTVSEMKASTENYFAGIQAANANRRDDVPPSQGGKYGGFGSNGQSHTMKSSNDDLLAEAMSSISAGWTMTVNAATKAAEAVNEKVIAPTREKLADGEFWDSLKEGAQKATTKMKESIESMSSSNRTGRRRAQRNTSQDGDAFFDSFDQGSRTSSSSASRNGSGVSSSRRVTSGNNGNDDGWDDAGWNDDGWGKESKASSSKSPSKASRKKKGGDDWDDSWGDDW